MEVVYPRCCGLDVHKRSVSACVLVRDEAGGRHRQQRSFSTMTVGLLRLADWLAGQAVTHVALESTGVYWKPVWNLLEDQFTLLLVNPQHVKAVPGRKTDMRDAEWLAELLQHGLLRGSRVPDRPQRELQELTRYRTSLRQERTAEVNRLQKTLEGANIKLAAVVSDVTGVSARAMLAALVDGEVAASVLAELAQGRLRGKQEALEQALEGRVGDHQRFLLARQLTHLDELDELLREVSAEIARRLRPFAAEVARLDGIPGVGRTTAEVLLAEVGTDLACFPSAAELASWAGLCPGNHESGGKRLSGRTRKGNKWLRTALVEAAQAAGRMKHRTYLAAQYHRLLPRRGKKRAAVAVAHSILRIAYELLTRQVDYADLGADYFERRDRTALERRLVRRLEGLGNRVTVEPLEATA